MGTTVRFRDPLRGFALPAGADFEPNQVFHAVGSAFAKLEWSVRHFDTDILNHHVEVQCNMQFHAVDWFFSTFFFAFFS